MTQLGTHLRKPSYEAVVVGTGFGGAVAACRLAQAGLDVAVLERGRRYPPGSFPRTISGRNGLLWERGEGLYDIRPLNDMLVVQAAGYGGGSLVYANVQMRTPGDLFDEGWPAAYSRRALDPYYDLVAHMLDITPVDHAPPDARSPSKTRVMSDALGALGRSEQTFLPNLAISFGDPTRPPRANRFGALQAGCTHCGECIIGCNVGAKNTLDLNYLALAERSGAEVATSSEVTTLEQVAGGFRLRYRDPADGGASRRVEARAVFLCMGAVNTTELLLRCRDQHRTLPRLSDALGKGYSGNVPLPWHQEIGQLSHVKIRMGRLVGPAKKRRQKGVDSLIVRDLIVLARERAVSTAFLLAGDEDLREGVATAQEQGLQVVLLGIPPKSDKANQALSLIREVDEHIVLERDFWGPYFSKRDEPETILEPEPGIDTPTKIASAFASAWASKATADDFQKLLEGAPRIPAELDVQMILEGEQVLGSLRGRDPEKREMRAAFWRVVRDFTRRQS